MTQKIAQRLFERAAARMDADRSMTRRMIADEIKCTLKVYFRGKNGLLMAVSKVSVSARARQSFRDAWW
jgi:hypothetical protein